jgi:MFS family permease
LKNNISIRWDLVPENEYKTVALFTSSLSCFFINFTTTALNVAFPAVSHEFHTDTIVLDRVATSYLLASAVFAIPAGRLADIKGIKNIFFWGMALFSLGSVMAAFANSAHVLIICRVIQGLGGAMSAANSMAMVTAIYSKDRGRALAGC